jgi:hypothetical protein
VEATRRLKLGLKGGGGRQVMLIPQNVYHPVLPFVMLDKHPFFTYGPGDRGISEEEFTAQPVPR